jgi:hypothetical protein
MIRTRLAALALVGAFTIGAAGVAKAQDNGALLDLLVRKKLITDQEAENVRAELLRENAATSAGKWNISQPVTQIKLYGDARVRYAVQEGRSGGTFAAPNSGDHGQTDRFRYRLRLGLDVNVTDNWLLGIRLETNTDARSTNVTVGDPGNAIFGKSGINVGQLHLRYTPNQWMAFDAGKFANPFVTTDMVWDKDINPEGFTEQFKYTLNVPGFRLGSRHAASADGKNAAAFEPEPSPMALDLFANFGQFIYANALENSIGGLTQDSSDIWLLGWQVGAKLNFDKDTYVQVAPAFYYYTSTGKGYGPAAPPFNEANSATNAVNDLAILDIPAEIGWKMFDLPWSIFGDFAYNARGADRATAAAIAAKHPLITGNDIAYRVGLGVGNIKKKGDWEIRGAWQHSEEFALDPNLVDDDIFDGRLNMEGFVLWAGYAFTDAVTFRLQYARGERINDRLGTAGKGAITTAQPTGLPAVNSLRDTQMIFVDLNLKF